MTSAARKIELTEEQLEAIAERIAAKLRTPRKREEPTVPRKASDEAHERVARMMRRKGLR